MDNRKFEKLIDLIINENEEQARELFHDIVVEKSREIYESIMDEDMGCEDDMEEGMGGQVGDLLDEINSEEAGGMTEDADDMDDLEGEEVIDMDADDMDADFEGDEIEDTVDRIEDKLDQLMADFEERMGMGSDEEEVAGDEEDIAGDEEEVAGDEEDIAGDEEDVAGDEEDVMEAVQLKQIPGLYGSKIGGDNGQNAKSTVAANAGQTGMASRPVKFSGAAESVPTSPKGPSNAYAKGETQVKGAGNFKNAPGQKGQDLDKAPAPVKSQATGVNNKSPVAESKRTIKKIVK